MDKFDLRNKYVLKTYLGEIAEDNYFNDLNQIVRVKFNGKYFDFRYRSNVVMPNPELHLAIISSTEEYIDSPGLDKERQALMPGIANTNNTPASLPYGWVEILHRKQLSMVTNHQNGSAPFSIEGADMSLKNKTRIALTPPIDKDYTNSGPDKQSSTTGEETSSTEDASDKSIGIFINDNSIVIKSRGSQLTMGDDGIHIGGSIKYEESEHTREWMFDNTLSRFIPSTIPTGALVIPELPNVAKFARYAQVGQRIAQVADKTGSIIELLSRS